MKREAKQRLLESLGDKVKFGVSLAPLTSIRIGGPADVFVEAQNIDDLMAIAKVSRQFCEPFLTLGAGSNVLVRDGGIRGIVVHLGSGFEELKIKQEDDGSAVIYAEAAVKSPRLAEWCAERGFSGVEMLIGVPGTVGGAIVMNAGTREGAIGDVVDTVTYLDRDGELRTVSRSKLEFKYRHSKIPRQAVVIATDLRLGKKPPEQIRQKMSQNKEYRRESQPLEWPSLGSIFRNPPKMFVGQLVEEAGLKDIRVGGARISPKHGNFIINEKNAKARDVVALVGLIKDKIKEKMGVSLETEIRIVGEDRLPEDEDV